MPIISIYTTLLGLHNTSCTYSMTLQVYAHGPEWAHVDALVHIRVWSRAGPFAEVGVLAHIMQGFVAGSPELGCYMSRHTLPDLPQGAHSLLQLTH
jgi:hypothetical protein